jgi:hypothetical protein
MKGLKLRFTDQDSVELPLGTGLHGIGRSRATGRITPVDDAEDAAVRFCVDRRGVWMTVAEGVRGVHVNGREVRRMAMLRLGDAIFVDGAELRLVSDRKPQPLASASAAGAANGQGDLRVVLRGVGGQHHGRSFTLEQPRLVGSAKDADIRIDDPAFAERHARIEMLGEQVVLRDIGAGDGSLVNGEPVHDAVLQPGDQVVFDSHHRFVLEAPVRRVAWDVDGDDDGDDANPAAEAGLEVDGGAGALARSRKLPWLLVAALLLAGLLSALLLFGAG